MNCRHHNCQNSEKPYLVQPERKKEHSSWEQKACTRLITGMPIDYEAFQDLKIIFGNYRYLGIEKLFRDFEF